MSTVAKDKVVSIKFFIKIVLISLLFTTTVSSNSAFAANSFCAGKVLLPSVSLIDNSAYSVWMQQQAERFILTGQAQPIQPLAPHLAESEFSSTDGILQISDILVSNDQQTLIYNATLSVLAGTNPLQFTLQSADLDSAAGELNASRHACISHFNNPLPVLVEGAYHIRYELFLQDIKAQTETVSRFEIWDEHTLLTSYEGSELEALFTLYEGNDEILLNSRFAFITLVVDQIPSKILNRFLITSLENGEVSIRNHEITVEQSAPISIGKPVQTGSWFFAELGGQNHHARFIDTRFANPLNSQRWGVDILGVNSENGDVCSANCSRNEQFAGYGLPFIAVADGMVVAINDGVADNLPGQVPGPNAETHAGGNYVLVDIGNGIYAFYAHAIPHSFQVKVGDLVNTGQILGLIGNSGNSTAPHLHFHLSKVFDTDNIFNSEGIPLVLD